MAMPMRTRKLLTRCDMTQRNTQCFRLMFVDHRTAAVILFKQEIPF